MTLLGPCCGCEKPGPVENVVMLSRRSPVPGTGWGCVVCNLPSDGAVAVMCDACVGQTPRFVCFGYAAGQERTPYDDLAPENFDHDPTVPH